MRVRPTGGGSRRALRPGKETTDAMKVAQLRALAARTGSVVAKAGYLALAQAIESSRTTADHPER
jgi:hypothetical protein